MVLYNDSFICDFTPSQQEDSFCTKESSAMTWIQVGEETSHSSVSKWIILTFPETTTWNPLQPTIYKWLFQLDDSQSLHRKWLFHQTSIYEWLFGVPGITPENRPGRKRKLHTYYSKHPLKKVRTVSFREGIYLKIHLMFCLAVPLFMSKGDGHPTWKMPGILTVSL